MYGYTSGSMLSNFSEGSALSTEWVAVNINEDDKEISKLKQIIKELREEIERLRSNDHTAYEEEIKRLKITIENLKKNNGQPVDPHHSVIKELRRKLNAQLENKVHLETIISEKEAQIKELLIEKENSEKDEEII